MIIFFVVWLRNGIINVKMKTLSHILSLSRPHAPTHVHPTPRDGVISIKERLGWRRSLSATLCVASRLRRALCQIPDTHLQILLLSWNLSPY